MTTRNFRVNNGLSVGDIVIDATANTIVGLATAAPSADGDVSNKKYVDDQDAAIASDTLTFTNKTFDANGTGNSISNIEVADFAGSAIINVSETLASNDSDTALVTAGAIIDYVDAQVTASDLDFQAGSGGALSIDLDSETLTFTGGTGIDTSGAGNAVTFAIDSTVTTLTGTQTLTNKTLTSPVLNTGVSGTAILDEDNMATNSATQLATQQSIKAYVDTEIGNISSTTLTAGNTTAAVSDSGSDGAFTVTADGNTELVVNDTSATFSGNVVVSGNFTVNGTTTTVATTNTTVTDALIEYANGTTGTPANDAGIVIERGDSANAFIGFDESEDKFRVGTGTFTGASTGNLTITTGTLLANIEGNVTGNVTGNADTATALATARAIGGVSFDGTAAINLPGVNQAGNQNTSGTAAVATAVTASDESSDTTCNVLFVTAATGDLPPKTGTNLTFNSSTGNLTAPTFTGDLTGTATAAQYSDVAERFASDTAYEAGTVVALGGAAEITQVNEEGSDEVFGVISSLQQAAFKMNGAAGNDETHPYIAMTGRVNVKVIGTVNKGDRLISASVPGYAKAAIKSECTAFNVIGRALTSKSEAGQGTVLAAVRVSH